MNTTTFNAQSNTSNDLNNVQANAARFVALFGRILLAGLFVLAGIDKALNFEGTSAFIASTGLPLSSLVAAGTLVFEITAGLALIYGGRIGQLAAAALSLFTLVASVVFHNFWALDGQAAYVQQLLFMKNVAIAGALIIVASDFLRTSR